MLWRKQVSLVVTMVTMTAGCDVGTTYDLRFTKLATEGRCDGLAKTNEVFTAPVPLYTMKDGTSMKMQVEVQPKIWFLSHKEVSTLLHYTVIPDSNKEDKIRLRREGRTSTWQSVWDNSTQLHENSRTRRVVRYWSADDSERHSKLIAIHKTSPRSTKSHRKTSSVQSYDFGRFLAEVKLSTRAGMAGVGPKVYSAFVVRDALQIDGYDQFLDLGVIEMQPLSSLTMTQLFQTAIQGTKDYNTLLELHAQLVAGTVDDAVSRELPWCPFDESSWRQIRWLINKLWYECGIRHDNLSPDNFVLDMDGYWKVMDYEHASESDLTSIPAPLHSGTTYQLQVILEQMIDRRIIDDQSLAGCENMLSWLREGAPSSHIFSCPAQTMTFDAKIGVEQLRQWEAYQISTRGLVMSEADRMVKCLVKTHVMPPIYDSFPSPPDYIMSMAGRPQITKLPDDNRNDTIARVDRMLVAHIHQQKKLQHNPITETASRQIVRYEQLMKELFGSR